MKRSGLHKLITTLAIVGVVLLGVLNRHNIFDWWRLRGYSAPAQITQLAKDTTMLSKTERLFYVTHPEINDKEDFNNNCGQITEQTIVLGCYISGFQRIYILDVDDKRLEGIKQVTAAHEVLHIVYERLSKNEKERVNKLTAETYRTIKSERIRSTVESYKKAGADIPNELHSILGTEVRNLPTELEEYYGRYFSDRKKLVSFSEKYEKAFSDRRTKAERLLGQIRSVESQLQNLRNQIDSQERQLNHERASLESTRVSGDVDTYNAMVSDYNAKVDAYRGLINQYNSLVKTHNSLVEEYRTVNLESSELIQAIDSRASNVSSE